MAPAPLSARLSRGACGAAILGLIAILPLSGCTKILGIDGTYVQEATVASGGKKAAHSGGESAGSGSDAGSREGTGGAGGTGGDGSGGSASGGASDGGAGSGTGGIQGTGGAAAVDSGCGACLPPPPCKAGLYTGKFNGEHSPSFTVVGVVKLQVSGDVSFRLQGTAPILQIAQGTLKGQVIPYGTFTGVLTGTFNCTTQHLDGSTTGQVSALPVQVGFGGGFPADFVNGTANGTWNEHELAAPASTGSGTWTASYAGP
jgi:hypothetical protein